MRYLYIDPLFIWSLNKLTSKLITLKTKGTKDFQRCAMTFYLIQTSFEPT